jgi:hypothetical protein
MAYFDGAHVHDKITGEFLGVLTGVTTPALGVPPTVLVINRDGVVLKFPSEDVVVDVPGYTDIYEYE